MTAQANITPFVAQQKVTRFVVMEISTQLHSCVPACVRMVLAYYGRNCTEEELRQLLGTGPHGTPARNLFLLGSLGFDVQVETSNLTQLGTALAAGTQAGLQAHSISATIPFGSRGRSVCVRQSTRRSRASRTMAPRRTSVRLGATTALKVPCRTSRCTSTSSTTCRVPLRRSA